MSEIVTIGLDLAKRGFQVHGADGAGHAILRKKLSGDQVLSFFSALPRCTVAMEACCGSHYWGREISALGHEVRLILPAYVKPFVKRQKNDAADAEAICEGLCDARSGNSVGSGSVSWCRGMPRHQLPFFGIPWSCDTHREREWTPSTIQRSRRC